MLADLRYAVRSFLKTPILTAVIVATLALGIGANTAIFSVVDAVLLRPTPVHDIDKLAVVWETDRNTGTTREPSSLPDYLDFKTRTRAFERLAAMTTGEVNLTPGTRRSGTAAVAENVSRCTPDARASSTARPRFHDGRGPGWRRRRGADQRVTVGTLVRAPRISRRTDSSARRSPVHDCRGHAATARISECCRSCRPRRIRADSPIAG